MDTVKQVLTWIGRALSALWGATKWGVSRWWDALQRQQTWKGKTLVGCGGLLALLFVCSILSTPFRGGRSTTPTPTAQAVAEAQATATPKAAGTKRPTIAPNPTSAPKATNTAVPFTSTPQPTRTAVPTNTTAPTLARKPLPTKTKIPTATHEPSPTAETLANQIHKLLTSDTFQEPVEVSASNGEVEVVVFSDTVDVFGNELQGIDLVNHAELIIYLSTYTVLQNFEEVVAVTTQVNFDNKPAYRAKATRQQAYSFNPGSFRAGFNISEADPGLLYTTALSQRLITKFDRQILAPELLEATTQIKESDIVEELSRWISAAEVSDISIRDKAVFISLDLWTANMYYDTYGEDSQIAKEQVELDAGLTTVDTIYGLMTRFPTIEEITVTIFVNEDIYYAHRCTRQRFEEIGADSFERAESEGNPQPILEMITRI